MAAGWKSRCVGGKPAQQVTSHHGSPRPSRRDCLANSQAGAMDLGTFSKQTLKWLHSFSYPLGQSLPGYTPSVSGGWLPLLSVSLEGTCVCSTHQGKVHSPFQSKNTYIFLVYNCVHARSLGRVFWTAKLSSNAKTRTCASRG